MVLFGVRWEDVLPSNEEVGGTSNPECRELESGGFDALLKPTPTV